MITKRASGANILKVLPYANHCVNVNFFCFLIDFVFSGDEDNTARLNGFRDSYLFTTNSLISVFIFRLELSAVVLVSD